MKQEEPDLGTPELRQKKRSQKKRGGVDFLLSRRSITKKQAYYARQYKGWYEARHKESKLSSSLGKMTPRTGGYHAAQEDSLIAVMAKEDWYRVVSDELSARGLSTGRYFWDALDLVVVYERPISEFPARLLGRGITIRGSTASRWVREAFQELVEIIETEIERRRQDSQA